MALIRDTSPEADRRIQPRITQIIQVIHQVRAVQMVRPEIQELVIVQIFNRFVIQYSDNKIYSNQGKYLNNQEISGRKTDESDRFMSGKCDEPGGV